MNQHKTNLALIIILALINIFLAVNLVSTYKETKILPDDLVTEAKENLASRNITFDTDIVDKKYNTKSVYKYSSSIIFAEEMKENAQYTHPALLSALSYLSSQSSKDLDDNVKYFDVPDGTSVSISDKDGNSKASAIITGNSGFEYSDASFNSLVVVTEIKNSLSNLPKSTENIKPHKEISGFFKSVYGTKIKARCLKLSELDGGQLYTCILTIDGDDINGMPICFYIKNGKILHVNGNIFFVSPKFEYSAKLIDGINILYSLRQFTDKPALVLSQKHEYSSVKLENGEVYIFPVWRIECIIDSQTHTPIFNALTGEYMKNY